MNSQIMGYVVGFILAVMGIGGAGYSAMQSFDSGKASKMAEETGTIIGATRGYLMNSTTSDFTGVTAEKVASAVPGSTLTGTGATSTLGTKTSVTGATYTIASANSGKQATITINGLPAAVETLVKEKLANIDATVTDATAGDGTLVVTING